MRLVGQASNITQYPAVEKLLQSDMGKSIGHVLNDD